MLKLISSSGIQSRIHRLTPSSVQAIRSTIESTPPLLKVLSSLRRLSLRNPNLGGTVFFCSDSSDGSDQVVEAQVKAAESSADEADSKAASAIVPTSPRPEDYLTVSFGVFVMLGS